MPYGHKNVDGRRRWLWKIKNPRNTYGKSSENYVRKITPIQAIAWTIQTNLGENGIDKIVRQGDCVLIKKKKGASTISTPRHLTEQEYKELLVLES